MINVAHFSKTQLELHYIISYRIEIVLINLSCGN